jgi:hypothetical protein
MWEGIQLKRKTNIRLRDQRRNEQMANTQKKSCPSFGTVMLFIVTVVTQKKRT